MRFAQNEFPRICCDCCCAASTDYRFDSAVEIVFPNDSRIYSYIAQAFGVTVAAIAVAVCVCLLSISMH